MYRFIIYSRRSQKSKRDNQYTHLTNEYNVQNYLESLDRQGIPYEVVDSYEEDISGGGYYTKRPIFKGIVERCKQDLSLTLLVAKADRLARNARTGTELMETINFILANSPDASDLEKQFQFIMAEKEWKLTSERWKDSYRAKKARCEKQGIVCEWGANSKEYKRNPNNPNSQRRRVAQKRDEILREPLNNALSLMKKHKIKRTYANISETLADLGVLHNEKPLTPSKVQTIMERLEISR